jgi:hypothetical protein
MSDAMGKWELWRQRMRRYEQSGFTVAEFCDGEGVSAPSFYQWRKRFAEVSARSQDKPSRQKHRRAAASAFQQVTLAAPGSRVAVELGSGVRLELPAENVELVRTVVAELMRAEHESRRGDGSC